MQCEKPFARYLIIPQFPLETGGETAFESQGTFITGVSCAGGARV